MMKDSWLLLIMFAGFVIGNFQAQGAENITLSTILKKENVGKVTYPKLFVNDTQPLRLRCVFNTTAPQVIQTVTWKHNNEMLQKGEEYDMKSVSQGRLHSMTLEVKKPSIKSVGEYRCEISIAVAETFNKVINVFGPPFTVLGKSHSVRTPEASNPKLTCSYRAHPSDDVKVQWFKGNYSVPYSEMEANVQVEDEVDKNGKVLGIKNVLSFTDIKENQKGIYFCKVTTALGTDYLGWQLRVKNRLAFLWPLIGIILEAIVVIIIIVVYEAKRSRKRKAKALASANRQFTEEDCQAAQADYDADSEVRQRLARA